MTSLPGGEKYAMPSADEIWALKLSAFGAEGQTHDLCPFLHFFSKKEICVPLKLLTMLGISLERVASSPLLAPVLDAHG